MEYSRRDDCFGTVICRNSSGVYLKLDNGQTAFAYGFLDLRNGSRVCCSIKRLPRGYRNMEVAIDSTVFSSAA